MKKPINAPDIAVALNYDGVNAPSVTAKGQGLVAEQIIELGKSHKIPLHTDPALVKVLANIPLGNEIPRELYLAIAQVIAFAYAISGKRPHS